MDAYVLLVINGLTLASVGTMPIEQCNALKDNIFGATPYQITCVEKEPDCGTSVGVKCLGRADLEETKKPTRKRTTSRSRTRSVRR